MITSILGDRYQLLEEIARTAYAWRYHAMERDSRRHFAIVLLTDSPANDGFAARFYERAHQASLLDAPNIARTFDSGHASGKYYIIEEWVKGISLAEYVAVRGPLPVGDALAIAAGVAEGLAVAHATGIVHGALSPDEIVIGEDGAIKITGCGIARATSEPTTTQMRANRGVAHYASPEQAQGRMLCAASDVYSWGAILFRMLAGRPPFEGATPAAVALKHVDDPAPPLRGLRSTVPPELDQLAATALSKQPEQRYPDGAQLVRALSGIAQFQASYPRQSRARSHEPTLFQRLTSPPVSCLAGIFVFLLIITLGALLLIQIGDKAIERTPTPSPTVARVSVPPFVGQRLADAARVVENQQLRLAVERRLDPKAPPDMVIDQVPAAGQVVQPGTEVQLTVSDGPPPVLVPNVVGRDLASAQRALQEAQLGPGTITQTPSAAQNRGQVLAQSPLAGERVAPQTQIALIVGTGPPATATPAQPTPTQPAVVVPTATPSPRAVAPTASPIVLPTAAATPTNALLPTATPSPPTATPTAPLPAATPTTMPSPSAIPSATPSPAAL